MGIKTAIAYTEGKELIVRVYSFFYYYYFKCTNHITKYEINGVGRDMISISAKI